MRFNGQTLFEKNGLFFTFFAKKGGRALDEFDKDLWIQVGRLLGRVHLISKALKLKDRIVWRPEIVTKMQLETIKNAHCLLPDFEKSFFMAAESFIEKAAPLFANSETILLHGDCHRGNMIFRPSEGLFLIDFDDMALGPAVQDMWMLLPDTPANCKKEIAWFIDGYETFLPFNRASLNLIPALRGMRIIHFIAWCAIQYQEPQFKASFPEWGGTRYWNETIKEIFNCI